MESFQTGWKVSGQCGKFPDSSESSVQTVWKASGQSGKFQESLESFKMVWKVSRRTGKFADGLESCMLRKRFPHFWRIYVAKAIYALLAHICRENDLRTPSGKFLRLNSCQLESFDFLSLWGKVVLFRAVKNDILARITESSSN